MGSSVLAGLALVWVCLTLFGGWRWRQRTATMLSDLAAASRPLPRGRYVPVLLERGAAPGSALLPRSTETRAAMGVSHAGSFNMGTKTDN